jgi:hypothetical protein
VPEVLHGQASEWGVRNVFLDKRFMMFKDGPFITMDRGVGWSYAERGGWPVRRGETSWRKINGVWINNRWFGVFLLFRHTVKLVGPR